MEDLNNFEAQTQNAQFVATISVSQFSIAVDLYIYKNESLVLSWQMSPAQSPR